MMHVLSWNFAILRFCGLWRPRKWSSGWKFFFYNIYTCFTIFITYTFTISEFIEFILLIDDVNEVANNCLMLLSMIGICYKIGNFVYKREEIVQLIEILKNDICRPKGNEEISIRMKFDDRSRNHTLLIGGLSQFAVIAISVSSFFVNMPKRTLPFKAWLPFNYTSFHGFWIAFLHQILAHAMAATIGSIHDTIFYGLMAQSCSQLNILKSRFRSLPITIREKISDKTNIVALEREEMKKCVEHHHEILRFVEWSNDIFSIVIFVQFSVSTIVICMSTYALSKSAFLSAEFTFIIVYLSCMLLQIFLMCWNGNEVIAESVDIATAVYEMDWASLKQSTIKDLRIIMTRSIEPIRYTSGSVIVLSLDSYNSLMKLSYSAFNLLHSTSLQ